MTNGPRRAANAQRFPQPVQPGIAQLAKLRASLEDPTSPVQSNAVAIVGTRFADRRVGAFGAESVAYDLARWRISRDGPDGEAREPAAVSAAKLARSKSLHDFRDAFARTGSRLSLLDAPRPTLAVRRG